ncbi:family 43 glycosylhydrolase [Bacteroides bouchesdurhonensis]
MRIKLLLSLTLFAMNVSAQVVKDYNPSIQRTSNLQYFKPVEKRLFTGDCMPYYHEGTFYIYWLLDEGHHAGLGGLGGHQWALSTSKDLVEWKHYPVAVGIDEDWEKSICTGSVIADKGKFYAFYSTRVQDNDGKVHEQLSYAMSEDGGVSFAKQAPNPFYYAPEECVSRDFRDPKVFKDDKGAYHLFISGYKKEPELEGFGGYLVHLISTNLKDWKEVTSPLTGQVATPECSDYFHWNGWYYLLYSIGGDTYYVKSRKPYGPWEYPTTQAFVESWASVYKTAEYKDNRRIAVAYMPCRSNNKDFDGPIWGGNMLLREVVQEPDGTLNTKFLSESLPAMTPIRMPEVEIPADSKTVSYSNGKLTLNSPNGTSVASLSELPVNYRITMKIKPLTNYDEIGLFVRATDSRDRGYKVELNANKESAFIYNTGINTVKNLRGEITLDLILKDEFIDMNINGKRSIINRLPEKKGHKLFFFLKNGSAEIKDIKISQWSNDIW